MIYKVYYAFLKIYSNAQKINSIWSVSSNLSRLFYSYYAAILNNGM